MKHLMLTSLGALALAVLACQTEEPGPVVPTGSFVLDEETAVVVQNQEVVDDEAFLVNAFPPMLPATEPHQGSWLREDCLLCHETGVSGAPLVQHRGLPALVKQVKCRSCHIAPDPSAGPLTNLSGDALEDFARDAFPPTMPVDESHRNAWLREDCLLCHKWGVAGAPVVRHSGMAPILLQAKCRSCHLPGGDANGL